jgi:hypothetical protein
MAVLGAGSILLGAWFFYSFGDAVDHNADASRLQKDLRGLPGVHSATVDYSKNWFEIEPPDDDRPASASARVTMEPDASPEQIVGVFARAQKTQSAHGDNWDFELSVVAGRDGGLSIGDTAADAARIRTALAVYESVGTLGRARGVSYLDAKQRTVLDVRIVLGKGTTASDVPGVYRALDRIAREHHAEIAPSMVIAADGSGFTTYGERPTAALWATWRKLSAISLPGAHTSIHIEDRDRIYLLIAPAAANASLDDAAFRRRLTTAVRHQIDDLRANGALSAYIVMIGDEVAGEVDTNSCHPGRNTWENELNRWFWATDCSRSGLEPPDVARPGEPWR